MALYVKMVNLHSYAFAGTKMENAKLGSPSSLLCALPDHSVCNRRSVLSQSPGPILTNIFRDRNPSIYFAQVPASA